MKFKLAPLAFQCGLKSKMSNIQFQFVFVVLLFLSGVKLGSSLQCYHCSELLAEDGGVCNYPLHRTSPANIKECLPGQVCIKHITPDLPATPEKVIRDCGYPNYCETNAKVIERKLGAGSEYCDTCDELFCNSSGTIRTSFIIVILSIFMSLFL